MIQKPRPKPQPNSSLDTSLNNIPNSGSNSSCYSTRGRNLHPSLNINPSFKHISNPSPLSAQMRSIQILTQALIPILYHTLTSVFTLTLLLVNPTLVEVVTVPVILMKIKRILNLTIILSLSLILAITLTLTRIQTLIEIITLMN